MKTAEFLSQEIRGHNDGSIADQKNSEKYYKKIDHHTIYVEQLT